jgi:hypothetical protein
VYQLIERGRADVLQSVFALDRFTLCDTPADDPTTPEVHDEVEMQLNTTLSHSPHPTSRPLSIRCTLVANTEVG